MKSKWSYVLIFSIIVVTLAGIVIGILLLNRQNKFVSDIELSESGVTQETFEVSLEDMYPGVGVDYTVNFSSEASRVYDIKVSFSSDGETGMAPFIDVTLSLGGQIVQESRLDELLGGEEFLLALDASAGSSEVVFRYQMPLSVGNEAQNTAADFKVVIQAVAKE